MMEEISSMIGALGFPIVICLLFAWHINRKEMHRFEIDKEAKRNEIEERRKLVETIEMYQKTSQELLSTNKDLAETARKLSDEIAARMNIMEYKLSEIKEKVTN